MSEQYVYRYNDINRVGDGHAEVVLLRRVILWNLLNGILNNTNSVMTTRRKQKKNAARSAWHVTKEQAMEAWFIRKQHQLSRLKLALERVELCVEGVKAQGVLIPSGYDEVGDPWQPLRVKQTPDTVECGAGPVLSEYNWTEY